VNVVIGVNVFEGVNVSDCVGIFAVGEDIDVG